MYGRRAVALVGDDAAAGGETLSLLGLMLDLRFKRIGEIADLDEAIRLRKQALAVCPADSRNRAMFLSNLGLSLIEMQRHNGRVTEVDTAVDYMREAVASFARAGDGGVAEWQYLSNLALVLERRFRHRGELADLNEAISHLTQARTRGGEQALTGDSYTRTWQRC